MDMRIFTSILLLLSLGAYFFPVENLKKNTLEKDLPLVIFESPIMYTLNGENVNRVVVATHAVKYQNRDEMFNADIILKNDDPTKNFDSEKLKADLIVKKADVYTLTNNVKYKRDDFIKLDTDELIYDHIKKIAQNSKPFKSVYQKHILNGNSVFLDINNDFITAKNTHFEIDMTKTQKGKK
jgi:lipopolysaccharide assembly outer membrane protein LptD (OstA)